MLEARFLCPCPSKWRVLSKQTHWRHRGYCISRMLGQPGCGYWCNQWSPVKLQLDLLHHVLGQWPGLTYFFGQLISTFRYLAVSLAPESQREISQLVFFFFFCKVAVPITCAAEIFTEQVTVFNYSFPDEKQSFFPFQISPLPMQSNLSMLVSVYAASPPYPFLYFKNI